MASVRKLKKNDPSSPWIVEYTNPSNGKRVRATPKSGLKRDAEELRRKIEREVETGTHIQHSLSPAVAEVVAVWIEVCRKRMLADDMSPETFHSYTGTIRNHIIPQLGSMKLSTLTLPKLQAWIDGLAASGKGVATIQYARLCLKMAISEACRLGTVGHNVMAAAPLRLPRARRPQIVIPTKDEVRKLIAATHMPFRLVVSTACFTGLRQSEIRGLTWANVDLVEGVITVQQQAMTRKPLDGKAYGLRRTKSCAGNRVVAIGEMLREALVEWRTKCPPSHLDLVFPTLAGGPIHVSTFRNDKWIPSLKRAGMLDAEGKPLFHFHALRHVYATLMIEQGVPPKILQKLMGHASIKLTFDRYGHLYEQHEKTRPALGKIDAEFRLEAA